MTTWMTQIKQWLKLNSEAKTGSTIFTDLCMEHMKPDLCHVYLNQSTILTSPLILNSSFHGENCRQQTGGKLRVRGLNCVLDSTATSEIVKCQTCKQFKDFRGRFNWSQPFVSVTWILSPDGKHNLFKLPQRDLARQWVHSTHTHKK